jgi:aldehyde:ferredoxin oxidoreductase
MIIVKNLHERSQHMEQHLPGGYSGQILRVNLTVGKVTTEQISASFCRKYLGGVGFIAYYLLSELKSGIDPLGPENKLIFALGPLTGLTLGGCARHAVGAKSPLTGGIAKSEVGEYWGAQFKRAGFDALIIEGRSDKPVYLWIHNGKAEIKDAEHLWGKRTKETQESIRSELDDAGTRVAMIGPGGENMVKYACLMHGPFDAAGRGGMGAVMGSKNLKAVAVRGDTMPPVVDKGGVKKMVDWLRENKELYQGFTDYGTGAAMGRFEQLGNLPIRNFRDSAFPNAEKISAVTLKETISVGMDGCFACPVRCKKLVACEKPYPVDRAYGGPEYETIGALGSACGVDDLNAISKGSELCNAYSIDTISAGLSIAFAMECFENGFLTPETTGGIDLKFGNADAMLKMIELIARREGIGDLLAEGTARMAEKIGHGTDAFAVQVKKQEFPMHDPRLSKSLGLGYMVNPHGADHMDSLIDIFYCDMTEQPNVTIADAIPLGFGPAPYKDIGPRKVALFKVLQTKRFIADALVLCHFLPYSYTQYAELTAAVTGWDTSVMEQYRTAERILTMCRLFNVREGFSADDDKLPARFFQPTRDGALSNTSLDPEEMEQAKKYYYHLMGWDELGNPMLQKMEELGIDNLAAD